MRLQSWKCSRSIVVVAALLAVAPRASFAQQSNDSASAGDSSAGEQRPATPTPPLSGPVPALARWIELQALQVTARYRYIQSADEVTVSDSVQLQPQIKVRAKLDRRGRYAVHVGAFAGSSFSSSWNDTGIGLGDYDGTFSVKQLFVAAEPVKGLGIEAGGLYPVRGESTEITSYDNDGFMVGERITLKRPAQLYLDEVSVTSGYLGDVTVPSVFGRFDRLNDHNYWQVLAAKRFAPRLAVSGDFTRVDGAHVWREGVSLRTAGWIPIDNVRLELYQRTAPDTAQGLAVTAERKVTESLSLNGGYASIDRLYGGLNGDRFNRGARVFTGGNLRLTSQFSLSWFVGEAVGNDDVVSNKHRADLHITWNALPALQRTRLF